MKRVDNRCHTFTQYLERPWGIVRELIIGILAHCVVTTIMIALSPFHLYRRFVTYLAHLYSTDITTCITGLNSVFLRDFDSFHEKSLHTSVACCRMKGEVVRLSTLQKNVLERVVLKRQEVNPKKLAYPELQQCYTQFLGYTFFKWDRSFDIRNHVTLHDAAENKEMIVTKKVLGEIWESLMVKPYIKGKSPWEFVLVPNYIPEEDELDPPDWVLFFRLHHGMTDGLYFERIMSSLLGTTYDPNFTTKLVPNVTPLQRFLINLRCFVIGPYDLVNRMWRYREDYHALHTPHDKLSKNYYIIEGPAVPIDSIKKIKSHFKVAYTTILIEIISGGLRKFMLKKGMPIPKLYSTTVPFPKHREREEKMGNEFYLSVHELPLTLPRIQDRIMKIQRQLENLRYSSFMQIFDIMINQLSNLPSHWFRAVTRRSIFSSSYSTLPGPQEDATESYFGNFAMVDGNFTHGMGSDSLSVGFSTLSFHGKTRTTVFIDKNLVAGREEAKEILECLLEEYAELKKMSYDNKN